MTPVSTTLILLGLVTIFWPLAILLFKRNVLNAQWLMVLAMSLLAISFFLLGCIFNTFLKGEYLLLLLFQSINIITPPIIYTALAVLTHKHVPMLPVRILILMSLFCIAMMFFSIIIGGTDTYTIWTNHGVDGLSWTFFPNSRRYNFIVTVNFHLYWTIFSLEVIYIFITSIRQFVHFKRINAEYYTSDRFNNLNLKGIYWAVNIGIIIMAISQFTNPFADNHRTLLYFTYSLPLAVILFYLGHSIYMINNSAERLPNSSIRNSRPNNTDQLWRMIEEHIEKEQAFLNPDLSVFLLAEKYHTSEDDIIDLIHSRQGTSFGDYIDSLRIEYASFKLLNDHNIKYDEPDIMDRLAHQCGYIKASDLEHAFHQVMHTDIQSWCKKMG